MQHFVNLETFLWQAQHFFEPQNADYTSELTRERMKQCEDHSWSKEARGKDKARLFSRRLVHITLDILSAAGMGLNNNKKEISQRGNQKYILAQ